MSKHCVNLKRIAAIVLLCVIILSLTGCYIDLEPSEEKVVTRISDEYSSYPEVLSQTLPAYEIRSANQPLLGLGEGAITEAFAATAEAALKTGLAKYWYPQYLATVIIAVDRDLTSAAIHSWSDLVGANEAVGYIMAPHLNNEMLLAAMSYGLEGEAYTHKSAISLLHTLNESGNFARNDYEKPILICYDYYAAEMIKQGRNLEIIVPSEGTYTYEKGLLANEELTFNGDVDAALLENGFRLLDGRSEAAGYPDDAAYNSAARVSDYTHLSAVAMDATRDYRRGVVHERIYTSADGREHEYFVLAYFIIMVLWLASIVSRVSHRNMRRTVMLAGILILGWMLVRLIKYELIGTGPLTMNLWFTFYLFQLSLPIAFIWMAHIVDKPGSPIICSSYRCPSPLSGWRISSISRRGEYRPRGG